MIRRLALILGSLTFASAALAQSADLHSTITGPSTIGSGSTPAYTVNFGNHGPDAATNAVLTLRVTAYSGVIYVDSMQVSNVPAGVTCGAPYETPQGDHIQCTAPSLAAGFAGSLTLSFTATGTPGNMGIDVVFVSSTPDPIGTGTHSSTTMVLTVPQADLTTSITSPTPSAVPSGTTATYTATFRNDGPDAATNASLALRFTSLSGNILPANIQITSKPAAFMCSAPVPTPQGPTVTCTAATFASGATGQITATAQINGSSGQMETCAFFTSSTADPDTNGESNSDCVMNTVTVAQADLAASTTTASAATVTSGTTVTYNTAFRNDGPDTASNASLAVRFTSLSGNIAASNIQVVSAPAGFTCGAALPTAQGPTVTCTASSLALNASGQLALSAVITGTSGTLNVCSAITSATADPDTNGDPNGTCAVTNVQAAVTTTTSLTCPGTFAAGTSMNATVAISNPQGTNTTIALSSSNTGVATVPPTVTILAGQTSATFAIQGVSAGTSVITATPPDGFGVAQTCTATVASREPGEVENVPTLGTWALLAMCAALVVVAIQKVA